MKTDIEEKRVDPQGRISLPREWRKEELKGSKEVYIIRRGGVIKVIPKRRVDLLSYIKKARPSSVSPDPFKNYDEALAKASLD